MHGEGTRTYKTKTRYARHAKFVDKFELKGRLRGSVLRYVDAQFLALERESGNLNITKTCQLLDL